MDEDQVKQVAGIGAAVVGVAGAIATGYYFYASDDADKNRKKVSKVAREMKTELIKKVGKLKDINDLLGQAPTPNTSANTSANAGEGTASGRHRKASFSLSASMAGNVLTRAQLRFDVTLI